jgi:hypothetical protein
VHPPVFFNNPGSPAVYYAQNQATFQQQTQQMHPPTQFPGLSSPAGWFVNLSRFFLLDAY